MAPHLATSQHQLIGDMLRSNRLTKKIKRVDIAAIAGCSDRSVRAIASNLRYFGQTKAPPNGVGRRRRITPPMLDTLREHLLEKPVLFREEMAVFLYDEFNLTVDVSSISRALKSIGWTKKTIRHVAQERNAVLRYYYLHRLSEFRSYHLVYVDESGCDKGIGFR